MLPAAKRKRILDPSLVKFTARDAASSIERAQYSLDGGEWILVAQSAMSATLPKSATISLSGLSPGEHTIAVRAYDRFENVGSAKITFTTPAKP